ncbi:MAG: PIN domain-containing protein [Candidatus Blackburnbacteria bacterium]|nr:PIN domain-containing protein [Candidatus Blackburnbacteria bacterium]
MIFIDTNVILRFVLNDHPVYSPKARDIFSDVEADKIKVFISLVALTEVVFSLERFYKRPKKEICEKLLFILALEGVKTEKLKILKEAFGVYLTKNIDFPDAYQAILMKSKKVKKIYSFDHHFNRISWVKRIEE